MHVHQAGWTCLADELSVERIQAYVAGYAKRQGCRMPREMLGTLRVLLRYLHLAGRLPYDVSDAVPSPQRRQLSHVPRGISEADIARLLKSIDRSENIGKRDYAIIRMLSTYGVRGVHIRELKLDDVHWAENRIVFKPAKGGKQIVQHLRAAVGNSLLDYLREGRPMHTPCREVFLTCTGAP